MAGTEGNAPSHLVSKTSICSYRFNPYFTINFGTLARTRTERTLPFERSDFTRFVHKGVGTLSESRTHTFYPLKIVRLPIAPSELFS